MRARLGSLLLVLLLAMACARPKATVVLLPDPGGHVGHVTVTSPQGTQNLEQAGQGVEVAQDQAPAPPKLMPDAWIQTTFGPAMAAQPPAPIHFTLQFDTGSSSLTEASRPTVALVLAAIKERSSLDVGVVGHTDTAGSDVLNNQLARQRAEAVAKLLRDAGVDPAILEVTSHGKAFPLIPTGDNVPEPRNRRVEVTIR